jgi:endo-1,4-beta-xylanase
MRTAFVVMFVTAFVLGCSDQQSPTAPTQETAITSPTHQTPVKGSVNDPRLASTGNDHGFFWQCYVSGGSASISFPQASKYPGNFAVTWSNVGDVVAGKGWNPGSSHSIGYNIGSLNGSYNNFSIYGWTTNPLIEYYVCEKGSVASGSVINSISSDGHTYNFYKHQQVNQPSIQGTATFWQYLDNWGGTSTGSNHTVTTANHINNWRSRGGQGFGSYNLQILAVEAYGGKSGNCNATVWGQ